MFHLRCHNKSKAKSAKKTDFEVGSGNIYADIGLPNPEERLAKARLMHLITHEIERRGLTQKDAANLIGATQPDVSNITRGRGRTYSLEMLMSILHRLGIETCIIAQGNAVDERIPVFVHA